MINKICVLIRVYNRVEDLKLCVDIIKKTWKLLDYHIIVVSNGENDGYIIDADCKSQIDSFVSLKDNVGHYEGNSQLLIEGLPYVPENCKYTIILEADTWIYGDSLIKKYIEKLNDKKAVWASAQWYTHLRTHATDFAIVETHFVKTHTKVFKFFGPPEFYVANYLDDNKFKSLYIKEDMPINLPRYIKSYPYTQLGRFFIFPEGKMVTHHIEILPGGINRKKELFNMVANKQYFKDVVFNQQMYKFYTSKINCFSILSYIFPRRSWVFKRKDIDLKDFL